MSRIQFGHFVVTTFEEVNGGVSVDRSKRQDATACTADHRSHGRRSEITLERMNGLLACVLIAVLLID